MERRGAPQGATLHLARPSFDTSGPDGRLAELVAHLTGCAPKVAVDAVEHALPGDRDGLSVDDRLGVVAEAMVAVKKEQALDVCERRERRRPA